MFRQVFNSQISRFLKAGCGVGLAMTMASPKVAFAESRPTSDEIVRYLTTVGEHVLDDEAVGDDDLKERAREYILSAREGRAALKRKLPPRRQGWPDVTDSELEKNSEFPEWLFPHVLQAEIEVRTKYAEIETPGGLLPEDKEMIELVVEEERPELELLQTQNRSWVEQNVICGEEYWELMRSYESASRAFEGTPEEWEKASGSLFLDEAFALYECLYHQDVDDVMEHTEVFMRPLRMIKHVVDSGKLTDGEMAELEERNMILDELKQPAHSRKWLKPVEFYFRQKSPTTWSSRDF
eukprot:67026_1